MCSLYNVGMSRSAGASLRRHNEAALEQVSLHV